MHRAPRSLSAPLPRILLGLAASVVVVAALAGCAPEADPVGTSIAGPTTSASGSASPESTTGATPGASASATPAAQIPDDCREILSDAVLAQLEGIPLNDPAFGASGVQSDGSLVCIWADPAADTTGLTTTISHMNRGPALDLLNQLANDEGYTCYTPDGGTRCEKSWPNETYPVTDGRTLFWRDGIMIDTRYSNLAPSGYTASIVASIWG